MVVYYDHVPLFQVIIYINISQLIQPKLGQLYIYTMSEKVTGVKSLQWIIMMLFLLSHTAFADETSKAAKLKELMEVVGFYKIVKLYQVKAQKQAEVLGADTIQKIKSQLPDMEESKLREMEIAYQNLLTAVKDTWDVQEAISAWQKYYGTHVTENELDETIEFYKSPIGQKNIIALRDSSQKLFAFCSEINRKVLKQALKIFNAELENIQKKTTIKVAGIEKKQIENNCTIKNMERENINKELIRKADFIKIGERNTAKIEDLSCWVLSAEWEKSIPSIFYSKDIFPEADFLVFDISLRNDDDKPRTIPTFFLVDRTGGEYEPCHPDNTFSIIRLLSGSSDQINPGTQRSGRVIFDVPKQDGYLLKVSIDPYEKGNDVLFVVEAY